MVTLSHPYSLMNLMAAPSSLQGRHRAHTAPAPDHQRIRRTADQAVRKMETANTVAGRQSPGCKRRHAEDVALMGRSRRCEEPWKPPTG